MKFGRTDCPVRHGNRGLFTLPTATGTVPAGSMATTTARPSWSASGVTRLSAASCCASMRPYGSTLNPSERPCSAITPASISLTSSGWMFQAAAQRSTTIRSL